MSTNTNSHSQNLDQFIHRVEWLHEVEYGDFKRKLGLYIKRLEEAIPNQNAQTKTIFVEMRDQLIYNPTPDVEGARLLTLNFAEKLKQSLN